MQLTSSLFCTVNVTVSLATLIRKLHAVSSWSLKNTLPHFPATVLCHFPPTRSLCSLWSLLQLCVSWQPCPAPWEHLQAKHRHSQGWSNPSLRWEDNMRNWGTHTQAAASCHPPLLRHNVHRNFCDKPKRNGAVNPLPWLLATLQRISKIHGYICSRRVYIWLIRSMCASTSGVGQEPFPPQGNALRDRLFRDASSILSWWRFSTT